VSRLKVLTLAGAALWLAALAPAAHAATKTVDMGLPLKTQKTFNSKGLDVNDFFPHGVTIHVGDSVRFVPTSFHTVDLPNKGGKPLALLAPGAAVSGSLDAANSPFWFNGQPAFGFNPAVVLGSLGKKVTYTGAKTVESGLPISAHPKPMTVKFTKAGTYTYYCNVHAGMKGTVRVLAASKKIPTAAADKKTLAKQIATAAKSGLGLGRASQPADTISVGSAASHGVEYYGFVPGTLTVPHGTTVTFQMSAKSREDHTATTGPGDPEKQPSSYLGALSASFNAPMIDPRATYPSDSPAAPAALSPTLHGNGFWNSGVMDTVSASPLPSSSKVTFSTPGTYQFHCLIHPFMHGTVIVT
jgi:plastocyanin